MGTNISKILSFSLVLGIWSLSSLAAMAETYPFAEHPSTVVINLIVLVEGHDLTLGGDPVPRGEPTAGLAGGAATTRWLDPTPWGPSLVHFARQWLRVVRQVALMSVALM